jgi:putative radical SAM enzyme (TIGR03279 family)
MEERGLIIARVVPDSIAAEMELEPGDRIVSINGSTLRDFIDFRFFETEENLTIEVSKAGGEGWVLDVEKDYDEDLGVEFVDAGFGHTKRCANRCVFCFVDQMPPALRETLYVKDDDYRLSFWSGNFITLTNVGDAELERIIQQRLSPLFISVHTTNPELRKLMLGNKKAGLIVGQLKRLAAAGIEMHTQVVLCPGLNDGRELEKTVADLSSLWPAVRSLAVVPVGLTRFRESCYPLKPVTPAEAKQVVRWAGEKQEEFLASLDNPFIFVSDEFYLLAGEQVPPSGRYAGFPQLENGVGLVRLFLEEWKEVAQELPLEIDPLRVTIATGVLGAMVLRQVVARLNRIQGLKVTVKAIVNSFFGQRVTVTGLVTGQDLINQIDPLAIGDLLVIPAVMLKQDEELFLDDTTLAGLAGHLKTRVAVVRGPRQLVDVLLKGPGHAELYIDKK